MYFGVIRPGAENTLWTRAIVKYLVPPPNHLRDEPAAYGVYAV